MSEALNSVVVRAQNVWFAARDRESGQTLVEYALIIALIALAAIVALGFLSGRINNLFSRAGNSLNSVPVGTP
jgi:pilus assembly protein Flp/PilA